MSTTVETAHDEGGTLSDQLAQGAMSLTYHICFRQTNSLNDTIRQVKGASGVYVFSQEWPEPPYVCA